MAVIDDIMDQATLTDAIVGPVETEMELLPFLGETIAPMVETDSQYVSMSVEDYYATGIGQFRAPEASIPLMDITGREEREEVIELAYLDEAHRISPRRWEILTQGGEKLAGREARRLIEIGQILERRNERLTEWMRWQAFSGQLTIEYQLRDTALVIDYPFAAGHKPTAAIPWSSLATADPINDLKVWLKQVSTDAGSPGRIVHISDEDIENLLNNQKLPAYFNVEPGQPFMPTLDDVLKLLPPGTQVRSHQPRLPCRERRREQAPPRPHPVPAGRQGAHHHRLRGAGLRRHRGDPERSRRDQVGSQRHGVPAGSAVRDHPEGRGRLHAPAPSGQPTHRASQGARGVPVRHGGIRREVN
jgi:hypothetical protein